MKSSTGVNLVTHNHSQHYHAPDLCLCDLLINCTDMQTTYPH